MRLTAIQLTKRKLDVVVLGATGFTGRFVARELAKCVAKVSADGDGIEWAVAGRNKDRLCRVLNDISNERPNTSDLSQIPVIEVDINDRKSLVEMCGQSKVIVNCCGPYRLLGEQVVSACIDSGCHHIDVSGEPQYLETIQLKYHQKSLDAKVAIIGSCGFDSVPADLGVQFLKCHFDGSLNSVESYLRVTTTSSSRVTYNFATWHSLVYGYAYRHQLAQLRRQLYSHLFKRYQWKHTIKRRGISANSLGYCVPFPGSDRSVVSRTQLFNYKNLGERPVQMETYFTVNSLGPLIALIFVNLWVSLLAKYSVGQHLLMKYPHIFSFGTFNRQTQPKVENLLNNHWELILNGKGWSQTYSDPNLQPSTAPDKTLTATINGGDLAYLDTSAIVTQISLTILDLIKQNKLKFGVHTPATAFAGTQLIDKLNNNGIKFEIIQDK